MADPCAENLDETQNHTDGNATALWINARCVESNSLLRAKRPLNAVRSALQVVCRVLIKPLAENIRERRRRRRARKELLNLDESMLRDIGLTRHDVTHMTGVDPARRNESLRGDPMRWIYYVHLDR